VPRLAKTNERGYGVQHQKLRARIAREIELSGGTECVRCGGWIALGEPFDLGHDDHDRSIYRGPEHVRCNRATSRHRATCELSPEELYARGITSRVW
jgi:hypothetical protein